MKKLSVLIALALVLTIGGAYATWTYLTGDIASVEQTMGIAMDVQGVDSPYGTYAITSTPSYEVVPKSATERITTLAKVDGSKDLVITFTPAAEAEQTVIDNAIATTITISSTLGKYDSKDILTVVTTSVTINVANSTESGLKWVKGDDGVFTATITADTFLGYLDINEITLGTLAEANAYKAVLTAENTGIKVVVAAVK